MSGMGVCPSKALGHTEEPEFVDQFEGEVAKHEDQDCIPLWRVV